MGYAVSTELDATLWIVSVAVGGEFSAAEFSKPVELEGVEAGPTEVVFKVGASGMVVVV